MKDGSIPIVSEVMIGSILSPEHNHGGGVSILNQLERKPDCKARLNTLGTQRGIGAQ